MPKEQSDKRPKNRPNPHSDPSGSRRKGKKAPHGQKLKEGTRTGQCSSEPQTVESTRRAPSPMESGPSRPQRADLDISRLTQSFFEGAQHFQLRDLQFTVNSPANLKPVDGWELLVKHTSPNALHDSSARYDPPKCDEDTRVKLTSELMDRISNRDRHHRLLCMTGAAGSGKSALQQSIAELCEKSGILGSAYFFSSADPSRNHVSAIVPTIAFQLGSHNRDLKEAISAAVAHDPVVFERSLQAQMDRLVVRPMRSLGGCARPDIASLPHAILIDGLDECKAEDRQEELLSAVRECLLTDDLPFSVFIASRPEWAIRTALEPGGHLHAIAYLIQLDNYCASDDMARFLRKRFEKLSLKTGNPHWFTEQNIETLVRAGSGQFIYVETAYRYISERRSSPTERLKILLTWTPHEGQTARPFEALDRLYTNILLRAKNAYEAIDTHYGRDFLLLFKIYHNNVVHGFSNTFGFNFSFDQEELTRHLGLEAEFLRILISDLHSLVSVTGSPSDCGLNILHKSFSDFLDAKSRAKDLFVPLSRVDAHMAKCCLARIIQSPDSDVSTIISATQHLPVFWTTESASIDDEIIDFTLKGGWHKIDRLPPSEYKGYYWPIVEYFDRLTAGIKNRNPDLVGMMRSYFEKWKKEHDNHCQGDVTVTLVSPPPNPEPVDSSGWRLLLERISRNALHDSSVRYDAPKCDEDTRVEVIKEIMNRIEDRQRLICMTGAAGSGKSTLQQTIAELCEEAGILGSAYFFSSADAERNTISTIVPTIAFQLGLHNRHLKEAVNAAVVRDPTIFSKSLRTQMAALILRPMRQVRDRVGLNLFTLPHAILIDGLDECKDERRQAELLAAIKACLLADDLPFCVFIASRPELAIRSALQPGGDFDTVAYHIQLSDHYDASGDMHRFLQRRFKQLSARIPNPLVYTVENIETLVKAGSGQFIYVATVYRWISEPRASPTERLKIVLNWTPRDGHVAQPFEALDRLYTNILLHAKYAYEAVDTHSGRDFLLLFRVHHINVASGLLHSSTWNIKNHIPQKEVSGWLDLGPHSVDILISDLHSLLSFQDLESHTYLKMHHKSFTDFLDAESRAKDLYVSPHRVHQHLARCCLQRIVQSPESEFSTFYLPTFWHGAATLGGLDDDLIEFTQKGGWVKIDARRGDDDISGHDYYTVLKFLDQLTKGIQDQDSVDAGWIPLVRCSADFPIEVFEIALLNLVHHPEYNSTLILRSEALAEWSSPSADGFPESVPRSVGDLKPVKCIRRKLLPRRPGRDAALEQYCTFYAAATPGSCNGEDVGHEAREIVTALVLTPIVEPGGTLPYYHPSVHHILFSYIPSSPSLPSNSSPKLQIAIDPLPGTPTTFNSRLHRTSLALLETLHRYGWGALGNYKKRVIHDCLVKREAYQDLYLVMRERHKGLVGSWREVTDPYKHVFEDIGIATFLMLLWKDTYPSSSPPLLDGEDKEPWKHWGRPPGGFIDFGCGNGLLTHILISEGYEGVGIDLRARTSWDHYPQLSKDALRVCAFSPFDLVPSPPSSPCAVPAPLSPNDEEGTLNDSTSIDTGTGPNTIFRKPEAFIIANHADELTPWVPVVATLTDASGYLSIPCCAWGFDRKFEKGRTRTRTDDALKQEMIDIIEDVKKRGLFKTRKPEGKAGEH
ncbi:hypothetical protein MD484_g7816, partial [Candolleomyces efflorescens]